MLRGNCWCLQNQIGVWSPPMSSDSWNMECMPLGDLYVFVVECVAVESNSGPLWLCWERCCCRVEALAALPNPIGNMQKGIMFFTIMHLKKTIARENICFMCLVELLKAEKICGKLIRNQSFCLIIIFHSLSSFVFTAWLFFYNPCCKFGIKRLTVILGVSWLAPHNLIFTSVR